MLYQRSYLLESLLLFATRGGLWVLVFIPLLFLAIVPVGCELLPVAVDRKLADLEFGKVDRKLARLLADRSEILSCVTLACTII